MKKIIIKSQLYEIFLWNNEYLFIACRKDGIKLLEKDNEQIINLNGQEDEVISIKKIFIPKYGECLISQGKDCIKLWVNKI